MVLVQKNGYQNNTKYLGLPEPSSPTPYLGLNSTNFFDWFSKKAQWIKGIYEIQGDIKRSPKGSRGVQGVPGAQGGSL